MGVSEDLEVVIEVGTKMLSVDWSRWVGKILLKVAQPSPKGDARGEGKMPNFEYSLSRLLLSLVGHFAPLRLITPR
ncbi:MAG: hypothetical protein KME30_00240 [Iphinoe sp. HA4291-MV1]|jgi:hypothetical protein|nr:hypothetical protein [Iphinoe sp. HA4291-MV1]